MPGERLVRVGGYGGREREEERSRGETGEGKKTMSRSVKAEASPGLDLRVMITPADRIIQSDFFNRAGFSTSAGHLYFTNFTLLFLHNVHCCL